MCGGCGQPLAECMDPRTQYQWQIKTFTCEACRILEAAQENDESGSRKRGLKYTVVRREASRG